MKFEPGLNFNSSTCNAPLGLGVFRCKSFYLHQWPRLSIYNRAVGSFFYGGGGGLGKNVNHYGWATMKNKKKH